MSRVRDESGQVASIVAVSMLGLLAVVGLVIDGGLMFSARRQLQSLADGAARAGAMAIDERTLRETKDDAVQLDAAAAETAARSYLAAANFQGEAEVLAESEQIEVRLRKTSNTALIGFVGIDEFDSSAVATAVPRTAPR